MATFATANTIAYYPDQASAFAACQNDGAIPGSACSPGGFALVRWCGTYNGCGGGGCTVIEQSSQAPYPGGQCPYSVQTEYHVYSYPTVACPAGYTFTGPLGTDCLKPEKSQAVSSGQPTLSGGPSFLASALTSESAISPVQTVMGDCSFVGNPCDAASGNKIHIETDFTGGYGIPSFRRTYNSLSTRDVGLGQGWSHTYSKRLVFVSSTQLQYVASNGSVTSFTKSGSTWSSGADIKTKLTVANGFYTFTNTDGSIEVFNPKGLLASDTDPKGLVTTYTYSGDGYLLSVTGPFGHKITIAWSAAYTIGTVTFPDGSWVKFSKDSKYNLVSATRSDSVVPAGVVTQYLYEDTTNPHSLTGIVDANGSRFATYAYDATSGKAVSTQHSGGTGKFTLAYNGNQTIITDASGNTQTLTFASNLGVNLLVSRTDSSDSKTRSQSFDTANNLISRTDEESRVTNYTWDALHRLTSTTEAAGTAAERTTTYTYLSSDLDLPSTIVAPGSTTTIAYTGKLPSTITTSDGGSSRTITLTYTPKGQVASITGPRVDVTDTRTLEYWDCSTGSQCGQLKKMTNALGHATTFDQYDGAGRLLKTTSPNGMATTFVYNKAGNVTSVTETPPAGGGSARATSFTYDNAQQLKTASLADGVVLTYAYDAAHRLTSVTDNAGNKVAYAYDLKDNRTQTVVKDSDGTIRRQVDYAFNARNFVTSITAGGSVTQMGLDAVGNTTSITDPNGHATTYAYDPLNRITSVLDRLQGTASTGYDSAGHLASLTAPNDANWAFTTDGLGNQEAEASPDRGQVQRTFDAAGNVLSSTDARGVTANFAYDALNRLTSITYPTAGEDVSYSFDGCANGIGRLCSVTDPTGSRAYTYDGLGRIASVSWAGNGPTTTTSYTWTPADKLASITYPSGRTVAYTRNSLGQISAITTGGQNIVSGRTYRADGLLTGQTYGNGLVDTRSYDIQGRLTSWTTGTIDSRAYGYDANGNITSLAGSTFTYDWLDRIVGSNSALNFMWDANGNREGDGSGFYAYAPNSNRMTSSPAGAVDLDAAGNTLSLNGLTFEYNQAGRMVVARSSGNLMGQYAYSFDNHRAQKTVQGVTTLFHYGANDNLLAETNTAGTTLKEYVWDDEGRPLAQIVNGVISYLHPDHLGSPRFATDNAKNIVWQWQDLPFGIAATTGSVTVALRYPGQYHEAETGLFQNWNRTYDKASGRYLESDSLGLFAGSNTFAYAGNNPLSRYDLMGLDWKDSVSDWWQTSLAGIQSATPTEVSDKIIQGLPVVGFGIVKGVGAAEQCVAKFSRIVPGGGLAAHEAAGGHLLSRHVGLTAAELTARLANDPGIKAASTFLSRADAEAAAARAIKDNASVIVNWINNGAKGRLALEAPFSGGLVQMRNATSPVASSNVRVILEGTGNGQWRIITGYPLP
ncbi:MAG: hypothetical protein FD131_4596 [Rhodocyclaceae bacterium]|nr:MAG: hypothetical protein FD131_4596 [Rhodocyclaceae bacterium]